MRTLGRRLRKWFLAMALFLGVAMGTATLYAVDCRYECYDCVIWYLDCDVCGGSGCGGGGVGGDWYCWRCGGGEGEFECEPVGGR